jgi:hypothetical protein
MKPGSRQPNTPTGTPDLQLPGLKSSTLKDYLDFLMEQIRQKELLERDDWRISKDISIRPCCRRDSRESAIYYRGVVGGLHLALWDLYERLQKEVVA